MAPHVLTRSLRQIAKAAETEGWSIFSVWSGAVDQTADSPDYYQLERLDEAGIFESDEAAWRYIVSCAAKGSELHLDALAFLRDKRQIDYTEIMKICTAHQRLQLLAFGLESSPRDLAAPAA